MTPKMPTLFDQYEGKFMEVHFAFGDAGQGKSIGYLRRKIDMPTYPLQGTDDEEPVRIMREFWVIVTEPAVGGQITTEVALDAANIVMIKVMDVEAYKQAVDEAKAVAEPSRVHVPQA